MKPTLYLDIGPLQENNFTGIPAVTAAVAEQMLNDEFLDARFIWDRYIVPPAVVASLLEARDGRFFRYHLRNGRHTMHLLGANSVDERAIALFPNVKGVHGVFRREAQIVHDFSTLLFPETHHPDTIRHHALSFLRDLTGNEFTFCVSDATRTDLLSYFDIPAESVYTALLGADEPPMLADTLPVIDEPFIAVLGTLEPRKNIRLILQMLQRTPEWASRYRFVFIGRFGWGKKVEEVLAEFPQVLALYRDKRLVFTGYVDDATKQVLLHNARVLLFPSVFEGFGLPVLEAMKLGTPVVCSFSSSLPEVAGDVGFYFDPYSVESMERALEDFEAAASSSPEALREKVLERAAQFTWSKFYRSIRDVLFPNLA